MPRLKFLVIEDDLFYRTYVDDLLAGFDVETISAEDGEAGFALAVSEKPDLIISDIEVPKIQGFVLLRMVRERPETRNIPVILMSGKVEKDLLVRHSQLRDRADGYLTKPFSGQDLMEQVNKVLNITQDTDTSEKGEKGEGKVDKANPEPLQTVASGDRTENTTVGSKRPVKALVVDDSRYICDITSDFLSEIGYQVKIAMDGEEGLKMALDYHPDLILLDVQMPKLSGFVVCEILRKEETTRKAVIVIMSAVVDSETFEKHARLKYHADAYLQKPFMKSELQDLVKRLVSRTGGSESILERRTGFLIPAEGETVGGPDQPSSGRPEDDEVENKLNELRSTIESLKERDAELSAELRSLRTERDQFEEEVFSLRSKKDGKEGELQNKIALLSQRFEETKLQNDSLLKENEALKESGEKKLKEMRDNLEESRSENAALVSEMESVKEELKALKEGARTVSEEVEPGEVSQDKVRVLEDKCRALERDFAAALTAKNEIEEQVKYVLEKRDPDGDNESLETKVAELSKENRDLLNRIDEAESRIGSLAEVESQLSRALKEFEELEGKFKDANAGFSRELNIKVERIKELEDRLSTAENGAAGAEAERETLQDRVETAEGEIEILQKHLDNAKAKISELMGELSSDRDLELRLLDVEKENAGLTIALENSGKLRENLERKISELTEDIRAQNTGNEEKLDERLDKLEAALNQTVLEAQTVISQQNVRESQLEESLRSLMNALQEDREAFNQEKERWQNREEELQTAFEDALAENRRIMGEETARLYPMLVSRKSRPLEVVTGKKKYSAMIAVAVLLIAVVVFGYLVFRPGQVPPKGNTIGDAGRAEVSVSVKVPEPVKQPVPLAVENGSYEDIWRRQTVQSVSDDMMIQATLHTLEELESALMLTAQREGWTRQRIDNALLEITETYRLDDYYYVTIYSKNMREGYPGYADGFEKHVALRDETGRETMAMLPAELEGSRFITSRVSAPGREINPDYLYEVGVTVSFVKGNIVKNPRELQLVIYNMGAVPMRVLTWTMPAVKS